MSLGWSRIDFHVRRFLAALKCAAAMGLLICSPLRAQSLSNHLTFEFGRLVVTGVGTLSLSAAADTRTATGDILLLGGGTIRRGSFDISGTPNAFVTINAPATVTLSCAGCDSATFHPVIQGGSLQQLPPSGVMSVYIGGDLAFTGSAAAGAYTVDVPITVTY